MARAFCFLALMVLAPVAAFAQGQPRVAVFPLDFGTVKSEANAVFGTGVDAGKGIADLIVDGLTAEGKYRVFERSQLDRVMTEQDRSNSSRFDASTAANIGRVIGVQAVIIGSITKLGKEDRNTLGFRQTKATISLSVRLVDTSTAQVLLTAKGEGEANRKGVDLTNPNGEKVAFGSNFKELVIGEATEKAVATLVVALNAQASKFPSVPAPASTDTLAPVAPAPPTAANAAPLPPVGTTGKPAVTPLTVETVVEMVKAKVPDDQIVDIVLHHENFAVNPREPSWAIAVAQQKISTKVQNAVRQKAGLEPLAAAPSAPAKPPAPKSPPPAAGK